MIRLALAEDHTIVRWALREALSKADDIEVVGEAGTAAETLAMVQNVKPDVLLLDITLPDRSGFDVLQEMRQIDTAPLVVVLTWHTEPSYAARDRSWSARLRQQGRRAARVAQRDSRRLARRADHPTRCRAAARLGRWPPCQRADRARAAGHGDACPRHDEP